MKRGKVICTFCTLLPWVIKYFLFSSPTGCLPFMFCANYSVTNFPFRVTIWHFTFLPLTPGATEIQLWTGYFIASLARNKLPWGGHTRWPYWSGYKMKFFFTMFVNLEKWAWLIRSYCQQKQFSLTRQRIGFFSPPHESTLHMKSAQTFQNYWKQPWKISSLLRSKPWRQA